MSLEIIIAGIILVSLTFYVLLAGADYGAGVWSLLARGSRAPLQRKLIDEAIGPIWEANHVWLILVVTVLFTAFPTAFAIITTRLHIPLTLLLIGVVLRGAGFAFHKYGIRQGELRPHLVGIFAVASVITPVLLGMTIGAIASGGLGDNDRSFLATFVWPWLAPFPLAVGLLTLVLFAFLAAVYLAREATDKQLREDFRRRALFSSVMVVILAGVVVALPTRAPLIRHELLRSVWGWSFVLVSGACAATAMFALWRRYFSLARLCAAGEAVLILWGWAFAQFPFLVVPNITISNAAASPLTLKLLLVAILAGGAVLFPSLYYLFRVFKGRTLFGPEAGSP
ncbi:MAG TPA: cytochrome d ubiquinol oxidase subunit II [Nitrospirales bacterium]